MKKRVGFVANSSSSSFLIVNEPQDELLIMALEAIQQERQPMSLYDVACEQLEASGRPETLKLLKSKGDKNYDLISFPVINATNEIYYDENKNIVINTCNNEWQAWQNAMESIEKNFHIKEIQCTDYAPDMTYNPHNSLEIEEYESSDALEYE